MNSGRRHHQRLSMILAGSLLAASTLGVLITIEAKPLWVVFICAGFGLGCLLLACGFTDSRTLLGRVLRRLCAWALAVSLPLAVAEAVGRLLRFDFGRQALAEQRIPPFFRAPRVPVDPVYFRRAGPEHWTGPVLRTFLDRAGVSSVAYHDEPSITVKYDALGFRIETVLTDWDWAITGDSFLELGHIGFGALWSTRLGELTGRRVRNLGVSHTGPLTQLRYLELYGAAPSTRLMVITFFEGNDLEDLMHESDALIRFRMTGRRDFRDIEPQSSFLRAAAELCRQAVRRSKPPSPPRINAWLAARPADIPLTLGTRLSDKRSLAPQLEPVVELFLQRFSKLALDRGVVPILIFMPCKTRVLDGRFRWDSPSAESSVGILPRDLPQTIARLCAIQRIYFLDLSTALAEASQQRGDPLFNTLIDSHLNSAGCEVVAQLVAPQLLAWEKEAHPSSATPTP